MASLTARGTPTDHWDHILAPMIINKLDSTSRRDWEDFVSDSTEPATFDDLKKFIRKRINTFEAMHPTEMDDSSTLRDNKFQNSRNKKCNSNNNLMSVNSHNVSKFNPANNCIYCSASEHRIIIVMILESSGAPRFC